jgi:thymidylate synthase (FAD)
MKIVSQNAVEIYNSDPMKHIESIGRICYKSEDQITDTSAPLFVKRMNDNKHLAMLEHFRFIYGVSKPIYEAICRSITDYDSFISATSDAYGNYKVSMSARSLIDAIENIDDDFGAIAACAAIIKQIVYDYKCPELFGNKYTELNQSTLKLIKQDELSGEEVMWHGWHSALFTTDRGVTHELVRHRPASFAQESTRYCNYAKSDEICVIMPPIDDASASAMWRASCEFAEKSYMAMIAIGTKPQIARSVLPTCTKADIVMTCTNAEWQHVMDLRFHGKTGAPHPQMKAIMGILRENCDWAGEM